MQDNDKFGARNLLKSATIEHLFPSSIMYFDWPEAEILNERIKAIVLEMQKRTPGVVKTNRGGWQSDATLQNWEYPEINLLVTRIHQFAREYVARTSGISDHRLDDGWVIRAWANVNEKGHFNRTHNHLGHRSFFSGVYYVDVGDICAESSANGWTVFENWTHVATSILDACEPANRDFKMMPKNGRMVLFPASLMHSVEIYGGVRPRITIAFNLYHPGFAIPRLAEYEQSANWMWTNFRGLMILKRKIPEKLLGLALIPRVFALRPICRPLSLDGLRAHFSSAVSHAFALASERFEMKSKSDALSSARR